MDELKFKLANYDNGLPVITGRGVGTETCEVDNVLPPDDLWFG